MTTFYGQFDSLHARHNLQVDGTSLLTGATTITGALTQTGALALASTLSVAGAATLDTTLSVDGAATMGTSLNFGTLSSSTQTGITLTATNNSVLNVFADDGNATLGNAVYSLIRGRAMLFKDATGITLVSVKGQIKCADEIDFALGVYAGVQGYLETMDDTDIQDGAKVWGVDASLESPADGAVTVDSGGILAGLHAELTGAGSFVQSSGGILAGLYIDEAVTTGQWGYGIYIASGAAEQGIYVTMATIGATNDRAMKIASTQATPAMADGYGVIEKELNVTGTATGHSFAESSWINIGTDATIADYGMVHNDGIYDGTGTLTNASIAWGRYHCMLQSNPAMCSIWSLNFDGAHSEIDGIFSPNDATLALGYQAGTPTKAAIGSVPLFVDSNGTQYFVYIYADADSD